VDEAQDEGDEGEDEGAHGIPPGQAATACGAVALGVA
jgi:hypothetical protein